MPGRYQIGLTGLRTTRATGIGTVTSSPRGRRLAVCTCGKPRHNAALVGAARGERRAARAAPVVARGVAALVAALAGAREHRDVVGVLHDLVERAVGRVRWHSRNHNE